MTDSASTNNFYAHLTTQINQVKEDGLYKAERIITTAQQPQMAKSKKIATRLHFDIDICQFDYKKRQIIK